MEIFRYAAGGFRFYRIASEPEMWRDISLANQEEILKGIDRFAGRLKQMRDGSLKAWRWILRSFQRARVMRIVFIVN